LDAVAAANVTVVSARLEQGNLSNAKSVGKGVLEYRIDFGPGYRVYFGRDGDVVVILLGSAMSKRQEIAGPTTSAADRLRDETWL
jgi:putative addiction module killer protein